MFSLPTGSTCSPHLAQQFLTQPHLGAPINPLLHRAAVAPAVDSVSQPGIEPVFVLFENASVQELAFETNSNKLD